MCAPRNVIGPSIPPAQIRQLQAHSPMPAAIRQRRHAFSFILTDSCSTVVGETPIIKSTVKEANV